MDNIYSRQEKLKLKAVESATVIGQGGTGSWVAILLAMSGCPELHLLDGQQLEISNFNRLPLDETKCLRQNKAEAIEEFILNIRPDCQVYTYGAANNFNLAQTNGVIFDCTDSQETQLQMHKWAETNKREYIRVGYDGTHITVTNRVSAWKVGEGRDGYTIVPSWVVPAVIASALGVAKAMYQPDLDVVKDITELGG